MHYGEIVELGEHRLITSIIMAGGATVAYVIGEGFADAARADTNEDENENENEDEK